MATAHVVASTERECDMPPESVMVEEDSDMRYDTRWSRGLCVA